MTITEHRKQYASSLAFDMLRGEDFHGLSAKQVAYLVSVVNRAYPGICSEGDSNGHPTYQTIRWNDGTSEWALGWWSRSGGGGQLVNHTLSSARDSLRRQTELRATKLELLQEYTKTMKDYVEALHTTGAQFIDMVGCFTEASKHEPSLRRQIIWAESSIAAVEAQREAAATRS